jgi:6,7-dimethyl-8-ribityllumazine synthase
MRKDRAPDAAVKIKAHLLIVEARFYEHICDELARGAIRAIERAGATFERVAVPGSLELPGAIAIAAAAKRFDGFVALGCVLRGETSHYDIVANESARGLVDLSMKGLCIGNGILTCENEDQAMARARVSEMDKGGGAAEAALAMVRLRRTIGGKGKKR